LVFRISPLSHLHNTLLEHTTATCISFIVKPLVHLFLDEIPLDQVRLHLATFLDKLVLAVRTQTNDSHSEYTFEQCQQKISPDLRKQPIVPTTANLRPMLHEIICTVVHLSLNGARTRWYAMVSSWLYLIIMRHTKVKLTITMVAAWFLYIVILFGPYIGFLAHASMHLTNTQINFYNHMIVSLVSIDCYTLTQVNIIIGSLL